MAGQFTDFWRIVKPAPQKDQYVTNNVEAAKLYSNFSWYNKVMKGAASRSQKYTQYQNMDQDVFVQRAIDTIAEEMSSPSSKTGLPLEIIYQNESTAEIPEHVSMTIRAALRRWVDIQCLDKITFDICRTTIKFGDCFFQKESDFKRWKYINPSDIIGISIAEDGKPEFYHVRTGEKNRQGAFGDVTMVPAKGMVHFTLSSMMGETGPFGESVLASCIKAFRHLSLLEDSVIIYRIVRAPERRVFFIDTGNMPPHRVKAYLESIKTDMRQKRIPNESSGTDKIDSVYNPISMTEDMFFSQSADGRGSRVETLPGGENLGEISDLNYFQNKFLQGLRIPSSYMRGGQEGGSQIADGKVGIAYVEELRFSNYVSRLQLKLNEVFDDHFKMYLKSANLNIDPNLFKLKLIDPQNFIKYKQAEVDEKMLNNYNAVKDDHTLSVRFKHMHFLGLSEDDVQENEALRRQEEGIPEKGIDDRLDENRMLYDWMWQENRPKPVVDDSWDSHVEETKREGEEPSDDEGESEEGKGEQDESSGESESGGEEKGGGDESLDNIGDSIDKL
jgi:hypothetical protein